jgi:hypothetical protein
MNLAWIVLLTATSVIVGTSLCFWLLARTSEVASTVWVLEHIACPIFKIIVLLIMVSLIYPVIDETSSSLDFWRALSQQGNFSNLLNILFLAGLLIAFVPVVSHPIFALPLQSILTIALVFKWQYEPVVNSLTLFPSITVLVKIVVYMVFIYFITRESSIYLSRWIDQKLVIKGSIRLVSDAIYLVLQIPVMLIYCSSLKSQLT